MENLAELKTEFRNFGFLVPVAYCSEKREMNTLTKQVIYALNEWIEKSMNDRRKNIVDSSQAKQMHIV